MGVGCEKAPYHLMSKGPLIPNFLWVWDIGFLHLKYTFCGCDLIALKSTLFVGVGHEEALHHLMSKGPLMPNFKLGDGHGLFKHFKVHFLWA